MRGKLMAEGCCGKKSDGFTTEHIDDVELACQALIDALVTAALDFDQNIADEHLAGTAKRMAKMYAEVFGGLTEDIDSRMSIFNAEGSSSEGVGGDERYRHGMVVKTGIKFNSFCAHHFLPFIGEADIGYIPGPNGILGLSKFARIVEHFARRPQVQERITDQVADYLWSDCGIEPQGVIVVLRANHTCESMRGIKSHSNTATSAVRGLFTDATVRDEFYSLCDRSDRR